MSCVFDSVHMCVSTDLLWLWQCLMRFCSRSTPRLVLISFTLIRYWKTEKKYCTFGIEDEELNIKKHLNDFHFKRNNWSNKKPPSVCVSVCVINDWPRTCPVGRSVSPSPTPLQSPLRSPRSAPYHTDGPTPSSPSPPAYCKITQKGTRALHKNKLQSVTLHQSHCLNIRSQLKKRNIK